MHAVTITLQNVHQCIHKQHCVQQSIIASAFAIEPGTEHHNLITTLLLLARRYPSYAVHLEQCDTKQHLTVNKGSQSFIRLRLSTFNLTLLRL